MIQNKAPDSEKGPFKLRDRGQREGRIQWARVRSQTIGQGWVSGAFASSQFESRLETWNLWPVSSSACFAASHGTAKTMEGPAWTLSLLCCWGALSATMTFATFS